MAATAPSTSISRSTQLRIASDVAFQEAKHRYVMLQEKNYEECAQQLPHYNGGSSDQMGALGLNEVEQTAHGVGDTRHESTVSPLPLELCFQIVEHVADWQPSPDRQRTLKSLVQTCRGLRAIAESNLWKDVQDLDTVDRQLCFAAAVKTRPELGRCVKSAHILWQTGGANGELLEEICAACPNLERLLMQRGDSQEALEDVFEREDGEALCRILEPLHHLRTFVWACFVAGVHEVDPEHQPSVTPRLEAALAKGIVKRLTHLDLRGWSDHFYHAFMSNISTNIESIHLGPVCGFYGFNLSREYPNLKELVLNCFEGVADHDLLGLSRHTPLLESLSIMKVNEDVDDWDWFEDALTRWSRLKKLRCGSGWTLRRTCLEALAREEAPSLEELDLWDISDEIGNLDDNKIMVDVIRRHAPTLTYFQPGGRAFFRAGVETFRALQDAKELATLSLPTLAECVRSADVDILLDTCPELWNINPSIKAISGRRQEWEARRALHACQLQPQWEDQRLGM
ncbi:hypothetical protein BS50DRAFT_242865 [Corynespora cassiicola Philippines]|uniref:F-box/LRR-repeat protein 15/At3g58940/PEG3-like LRR domain-containing protein n=1 Tax=Corynespora cassiicola Philippines TaxID=1448308 RepID=A0A2T2P342_CORCC|nr:hypothetical protein BS50DRAFT_242865 [Corynespora cassiicola Philippines]